MSLEPQPVLPPAIPSQDTSVEHAWMVLGQEYAHRIQLQGTILERAAEANNLHDAVVALTGRQKELLDELEQHRALLAESESKLASGLTEHMNEKALLESKLTDARNEAAGYMDEISRLKARLATYEPLPPHEAKEAA